MKKMKQKTRNTEPIIIRKKKKYRERNKQKMKKYYELNKTKILEKSKETVSCECSCEMSRTNLRRHRTSMKHIDLMNKI